MSIKLADAVVYLTADDGPLGPALNKAKTGVTNALGSMGNIAKTALTGAVVGGGLAAAGAVAAIGTAAFNVSRDTQQASNEIAASLGIPIAEAERFGDVAREIFKNTLATDVLEAGAAVGEVAKRFKLAADDPSLARMTENAFKLKDAFGVEITESLDAVQTLMENFGISADEAFNLITAGYQKGLDRSGDFLDTIGEYSTQFASGGASADQFFNLLQSGLQGGMLGTDKAADAFKEFQVRILDGSKTTAEGLEMLGINADEFTGKIASGEMTVVDAFNKVVGALGKVDDQATLMQAGVALIGTQFEDLGRDAALNLEAINESFAEGVGGVDSLNQRYQNFGDMFTRLWRRAAVAIAPLTDKLLELANDAMPHVEAGFTAFEENIVPAVETASAAISTAVEFIKNMFGDLSGGVATSVVDLGIFSEWFEANLPLIQETVETVLGWITSFWETWGGTITSVGENTFGTLSTMIDTNLRNILDLVTLAMQLITGDFRGAEATLRGIVSRTWTGIKTIFSNQISSLKEILKTALDAMGLDSEAALAGIERAFTSTMDVLISTFNTIKTFLTVTIPNAFNSFKNFLSRFSIPNPFAGIGESLSGIGTFEWPSWLPGGGGQQEPAPVTPSMVTGSSLVGASSLAGGGITVNLNIANMSSGLDAAYAGNLIAQEINRHIRRRS